MFVFYNHLQMLIVNAININVIEKGHFGMGWMKEAGFGITGACNAFSR